MTHDDLHDDRCISCGRMTVETEDKDDPRRAVEAPSGAYVLCARCHDIALRERGIQEPDRAGNRGTETA